MAEQIEDVKPSLVRNNELCAYNDLVAIMICLAAISVHRQFRLYRWVTLLVGAVLAVVIIVTSLVVSINMGDDEEAMQSLVIGASISSALLVIAVSGALIAIWMRRRRAIMSSRAQILQNQQEEILHQIQQRRREEQQAQIDIRNQTRPTAPPPSVRASSAPSYQSSEFRTASFWHQHHASEQRY